MTQIGTIKTITGHGSVQAMSQDNPTRHLNPGDPVFLGETLVTTGQIQVILVDGAGQELLSLGGDTRLLVDETVVSPVAEVDAVVREVQAIQAALEQEGEVPGQEDPPVEDEPAAGEEDPFQGEDMGFYQGDRSAGDVDPRLLGIEDRDNAPQVEEAPRSFDEGEEIVTEPEPDPVFIVGSNPDPSALFQPAPDGDGENIPVSFDNDVAGASTPHTVPGGAVSGELLGDGGNDTLVGDPGGDATVFNHHFIIELDLSTSMQNISNLKVKIEEMVREAEVKVGENDYGHIRISLQGFADEAGDAVYIEFLKTGPGNGVQVSGGTSLNPGTQAQTTTDAWVNTHVLPLVQEGLYTNYESALVEANTLVDPAFAQNHVIFLTDGHPTANIGTTPNSTAVDYFNIADIFGVTNQAETNINPKYWNPDWDDRGNEVTELAANATAIQVIGIDVETGSSAYPTVENVEAADGTIVNIGSPVDLLNAMDTSGQAELTTGQGNGVDLVSLMDDSLGRQLLPVGNDTLWGLEGNDLIFGDTLNTDGVAEDLSQSGVDVSAIADLPIGSGWAVFATLEENNADWGRENTLDYIQANHEALGLETVDAAGTGRLGGDDEIFGGDGDDIIYGQEGNDAIDGGAGDDILVGGSGNDTIDGGSGTNAIDGGLGTDTLLISADSSLDFSQVQNMEQLLLGETGEDQNLTLTTDQVFDMSAGNGLEVVGGETDNDSLTLDASWSRSPTNANVWEGQTEDGNSISLMALNISVTDGVDTYTFDGQGNVV